MTREIPDGFYRTVIDAKIYVFRIRTCPSNYSGSIKKRFAAGKQEVSLAVKNARTWQVFGIVSDGQVVQFVTWKNESVNSGIMSAVNELFSNPAHAAKEYAHAFGKCYVCNRALTNSESLASGIGPECAGTRIYKEA